MQFGREDGIAVRLRASDGRLSFAAASGGAEASLLWALERARDAEGEARGLGWASGDEDIRIDRVQAGDLPSPRRMARWLGTAVASISGDHVSPDRISAWVEAASIVETLVADGGLRASRLRSRAWAMATVPPSRDGARPRATERVLTLESVSLEGLDAGAWREAEASDGATASPPPEGAFRCPVLVRPEPASILVRALVGSIHRERGALGLPVGAAWRVADDPPQPGTSYGGSFDDAGFPTRRTVLADGRAVVGLLDGAGHMKRPSYRDPPEPMATTLVVEASGGAPPDRGLRVDRLRIHPIGLGVWLLEIDGDRLEDPGAAFHGARVRVNPRDLVRRCVATAGPARACPRGVVAPALVFDGLCAKG